MPKRSKRASADAPAPAQKLIAKAMQGQHMADPSTEALTQLAELLEHNDQAPHKRRVPADAALDMLHGFGWHGARPALDSLCRRRFGRRSYGTP